MANNSIISISDDSSSDDEAVVYIRTYKNDEMDSICTRVNSMALMDKTQTVKREDVGLNFGRSVIEAKNGTPSVDAIMNDGNDGIGVKNHQSMLLLKKKMSKSPV